jgi:hypothetical protein
MKLGVIILLVISILVSILGCSTVKPLDLRPIPKGEDQIYAGGGAYDTAADPALVKRDFTNAPAGTWVYPAKVEISNMFAGARAEYTISVHNGGEKESTFLIYYEDLKEDSGTFTKAPAEAASWISVSNTAPLIGPGEIVDILVVVEIPKTVVVNINQWGFLVVVSQSDQEGMIKVRNTSKWLVGMRDTN